MIPSDGFNIIKSESHIDFLDPEVHRIKERPLLNMINKENLAELTQVDRPVTGPNTGFGTIVNKHPEGHDKLWRETSYGEMLGYGKPNDAKEATAQFSQE